MAFCSSKWISLLIRNSHKHSKSIKIAADKYLNECNLNNNVLIRNLKKAANQLKPGNVIEHKGQLLLVTKAEHNLGTARSSH